MGAAMRAHDWSVTSIGSPENWPQPLQTLVGLLLGSMQPMFVAWGPQRMLLYNDAYMQLLASKHPTALARDFLDVWHEIADFLAPLVEDAYGGRPAHLEDVELTLERKGFAEQAHFTFSFTPVRGEAGAVAGFLGAVIETTNQALSERRGTADAARQRRLLEQAPGFIAILSGPDHVFEFVNEAFSRLFTRRGLLSKTAREAFADLVGQGFHEMLDSVFQTGERFVSSAMPIRLQTIGQAEPTDCFLDFICEPVRDDGGAVRGVFIEGQDVTGRLTAEAACRKSEERYRQIVEGAEDFAIVTLDTHGLITSWNSGAERITGYPESEALGQPGAMLFTPEDREAGAPEHEMSRAKTEGRAVNERWHRCRDGSRFWGSGLTMYLDQEAGGYLKIFRDRTFEHAADAALREREARFRTMADAVPQIVWITDRHGHVEFFNRQWSNYTGITFEQTTAAQVSTDHIHPDDGAATMAAFNEALRTGTTFQVEHRIRSAAGEYRWFLVRGEPYRDPETDEIVRWFGASVDIHGRKLAEAALQELNETLEQQVAARSAERDRLWNLSQDMLARADYSGMMSAVSPAWAQVLGWSESELLSRQYATFMHPDDLAPTLEAIGRMAETRQPTRFENRIATKDGGWKHIEWTVAPEPDGINFVAIGRDLSVTKARETELQAAQEALRQSQKMEAMGSLTGGVAHDFNNLLTPIIGSLDMLVRKNIGSERERRLIDGALQSAERAKTLVQRLLAFARRQPLQPIPVDLARLVPDMVDLINSTLGPTIEVRVDLASDLPPAKADPNQLEMALLNLAVNARDAMPEGGKLTVTARRESVRALHASGLKPGHYVRLGVGDTGAGMDEDTRKRAVEPFFSTKGVGKGTGLGLSMVHGLTAQLGGGLTIDSAPGRGTTVELWLPVSVEPIGSNDREAASWNGPIGRGKALLVDDEDLVRMSTADMLIDLGFEVVEAASAEDALHLIHAGNVPDLIVTDHLMPGMNGAELAREVHAIRPDLPVLIVSGYAEAEGIAPELPRLTKPFRSVELAASVSALVPDQHG